MSDSLDYRIENVEKHSLQAFSDYSKGNTENSLNNLRKACEAMCRATIIKNVGSTNGQKIILGEINENLLPKVKNKRGDYEIPLLAELLKIVDVKHYFDKVLYHRFQDIRFGGNNASHDPINENKSVKEDDVDLCIQQYKIIQTWFWSKIVVKPLPVSLQNISIKAPTHSIDVDNRWSNFYDACNHFSNETRFVLIAPPSFRKIPENQLDIFSRIKWSMILDFNPESKTQGLFNSLSQSITNQQIRAITIEEKDRKDVIISTSPFAINWVFANGLSTISGSISGTPREWRTTLKYSSFIQRLLKEFLTEKIQKTIYIYLIDDKDYLEDIIRAIDENISNPLLANHVIAFENQEKESRLHEEFDQYNAKIINIPISLIIAGLDNAVKKLNSQIETKLLQIPARSSTDEDIYVDVSDKFLYFLDKGIEVLPQSIGNGEGDLDGYKFYKGNVINWKELSVDLDAQRNITPDLVGITQKWLESNKGAYVVELYHKPGAGGTTVARRIAYNFHQRYPTVVLNKYMRDKTNQALFELSEISQKPILAILEAFQVTQNELNSLVRKINEDKKHIVILYVNRSFQNNPVGKDRNKTIFLEDKTLDMTERDRFYTKYYPIAPEKSKRELEKVKEKNPHSCGIIDFAITAYQDEFSSQKLEDYIYQYLNKLPQNHIKFVGFASMIYYYSQNNTLDLWFSSLFSEGSLLKDYELKGDDEHYLSKLFINELDENGDYSNYWRPRFSLFAHEMLILTLSGLNVSGKGKWKDYLSRWAIDLIKTCGENHANLTDDLRDMFKGLFLNRDNEDVLGIDEKYESSAAVGRKFSALIRHIANASQQQEVLQTLVDCYPYEAHFRGHLGRFLYENASEIKDFEQAYNEISAAIELGENDYNLWHIKGMCNRRQIEFIIRSDLSSYTNNDLLDLQEIIQELTEVANEDFDKSRAINAYNLHSHTAQIQMLIQVIDFGKRISKTKEDFIIDADNEWYENQLTCIFTLLDEAKYIIELSKDLDQSILIVKSKQMIDDCQGKLFRLMGNYSKAVSKFKSLSESSDRSIRPYFRKMYVLSTLASKVANQFNKFSDAWGQLSLFEFESLKKAIENNITEEPENTSHIKLWLQAVRYSKPYISIDECLSTIKLWYDNSWKYEMAHLEATYYMYVINACKAISDVESVSDFTLNETKKYIAECKEKKVNDKFSFEWYGKSPGIKHLVSYSLLGRMNLSKRFFENISLLDRVGGTIVTIQDRQKGRIKLDCGLDAFFVPSNGGFEKDFDETTEVNFFIGFRQDGLIAWEVQRKIATKKVHRDESDIVEIQDYDQLPEIIEPIQIVEPPSIESNHAVDVQGENDQISGKIKLTGPTVVGKIDLKDLEKYKKK